MPAPARRQILVGGNGRPGRKGARRRFAVDVGGAEDAGGRDRKRTDPRDAAQIVAVAHRLDRDERAVGVGTVLAPVEPRVSVEDLQAAEQQKREAKDVDPMRHAHRKGVPMDENSLGPLDGRRKPG